MLLFINRTTNRQQVLLHLFGCLCFIVLPFLFFPRPQDILTPFNNPQTTRDVIGQCLLIGFFYLTYYWLIPRFYQRKKHIPFVLIVVACFALITLLPSLIIGQFNDMPPFLQRHFPGNDNNGPPSGLGERDGAHQPPPDEQRERLPELHNGNDLRDFTKEINHYIFLFLVVLFFSLTLSISSQWKQTQKEKAEAELSYLKAQINPHFLFNTLNSIYSLIIQKSDVAEEAVVKLAGMMRYVLYEANQDVVPLDKEITYLRDYIALQKLRFGNSIPVEITIEGRTEGKQIAPLILISFVENAFKHGINAEEESHIFICLTIEKSELALQVKNNKVHVQNSGHSGIGIRNVQNRLQLLYPAKHTLSIEDNASYFLVTLHIELT